MLRGIKSLRVAASVAAVIAAVSLPAAAGAATAEKSITRDLVRRALLDRCVYDQVSREGVDRAKLIDACQCASQRFIRDIKDADVAGLNERSAIPDAWVKALTAGLATCTR